MATMGRVETRVIPVDTRIYKLYRVSSPDRDRLGRIGSGRLAWPRMRRINPMDSTYQQDAYFRRRYFHSPYDPKTVVEVITSPFKWKYLDEGPIMRAIYYSRLDEEGVTITAGTRLKTLWNVVVLLTSNESSGGTDGELYVDRPASAIPRFHKDIWDMFPAMYDALESSDATFTYWEPGDILK